MSSSVCVRSLTALFGILISCRIIIGLSGSPLDGGGGGGRGISRYTIDKMQFIHAIAVPIRETEREREVAAAVARARKQCACARFFAWHVMNKA